MAAAVSTHNGRIKSSAGEQIEAAFKTELARGEVGIEDRKPAPRLKGFAQQFVDFVATRHAEKPQTIDFYTRKLAQVLKFEPLSEDVSTKSTRR